MAAVRREHAGTAAGWRPESSFWNLVRKWAKAFNIWLWLFVFLPTLGAGVFYFGIASNLYVSEADFVVKSQQPETANLLGSLLQSVGLARSAEDTFAVNNFIESRDAVRLLEKNDDLRGVFDRPEADFVTRFPNLISGSSFEQLYKHYSNYVDVTYDSVTGVSKLRVKAYRAADAQRIAQALLRYSEVLVNRLNERAESDSLEFARREVQTAEENLEKVQAERARLGLVAQSNARDRNPKSSFAEFDALALKRDLAQRALTAAMESLAAARVRAESQHLYLERIVEPNLPDYPLYPKRLLSFVLVAVTCLVAYGVGWLLVAGIREHGSA